MTSASCDELQLQLKCTLNWVKKKMARSLVEGRQILIVRFPAHEIRKLSTFRVIMKV